MAARGGRCLRTQPDRRLSVGVGIGSETDGLGLGVGGGVVGGGLGLGCGEGRGLSVGLGLTLGLGLGVGDGVGVTEPCGLVFRPEKSGVGKFSTGWFAIAEVMKSCQISVGIVPPTTTGKPSMFCIEVDSFFG